MKKLLLPVIGLLLTVTLSAQTNLGGRYFNLIWAEDGNTLFSENNLTLIPHDGTYDFSISVKMHDGTHAWVGTDEVGTLKVENGNLWYIHPNKNYDFELEIILHPVDEDGQPMEDSIQIIEHKGDTGSPYPDKVCFEGIYSRVYPVFTDDKGYLYQMKGEDVCELINGGLYEGTVTVPRTVYYPLLDAQAEVVGIAEDAFSGCYDLEAVSFENPDIYIGPSAFMGSGIPYDYESILKPKFAYPNQDFSIFVVPTEESVAPEREQNMWMVFKQNIQPVWQSGNTASDEEKDLGRADFDFENNRGLFYTWTDSEEEAGKVFRGYEPYEVEALIAPSDFVARHRFPSFSRWKFGEPEREADPYVVDRVLERYPGHTVMYSRRVANIRQGSGVGELSMVEFEHKDGEAMVVFVWRNADDDFAMGDLSVKLTEESEEYGVWDIDDEGRYGIPDVVTIALDPREDVTVFLAKNSPEAIECYAWHQVGDRLEYVEYGSWYRFIP